MKSLSLTPLYVSLLLVCCAGPPALGQETKLPDGMKEVLSFPTQWDVYGLAVSSDGKRIATGNYGDLSDTGPLIVFDAITGKRLFRIQAHDSTVKSVVFSPTARGSLAAGSTKP